MNHQAASTFSGRRLLRIVRMLLFPFYNWGHALLLIGMVGILALIAIFDDPGLALYMGLGGYAGIAIMTLLAGLAPDEATIDETEVAQIEALMETAPFVHRLDDRLWAPARSRSRLLRSDWISIVEQENGDFVLKATERDLGLILAEIRPKPPRPA